MQCSISDVNADKTLLSFTEGIVKPRAGPGSSCQAGQFDHLFGYAMCSSLVWSRFPGQNAEAPEMHLGNLLRAERRHPTPNWSRSA